MVKASFDIRFINVGYGEAILLEAHAGERDFLAVIDGGSAEAEEYEDRSGGRIPLHEYFHKQGIKTIDLLICTHIHEDHICGLLPLVEQCRVKTFWQSLPPDFYKEMAFLDAELFRSDSQRKFVKALNGYQSICTILHEQGAALVQTVAEEETEIFPGLRLELLFPSAERQALLAQACKKLYKPLLSASQLETAIVALDAAMNNFSLILRLIFGSKRILLPGDTNKHGYGALPQEKLRADLYKLGHHGQADSVDEALFKLIAPRQVVCTASSDRRYASADPALLQRIAESGARLYYSDCPPLAPFLQPAPAHEALRFTVEENFIRDGVYE